MMVDIAECGDKVTEPSTRAFGATLPARRLSPGYRPLELALLSFWSTSPPRDRSGIPCQQATHRACQARWWLTCGR